VAAAGRVTLLEGVAAAERATLGIAGYYDC